jgi:hypothetical protein
VRKLADSLHAIIAADQQAYVEQLSLGASVSSHVALLQSAAQKIQTGGAEFSYTLRSLAPINPNNGPQTQVEQDGLARVIEKPGEPYYATEMLGGRSYFTAVYAERATVASCIECHNRHPKSPRHDWRSGDAMGAIVVRIPLEF